MTTSDFGIREAKGSRTSGPHRRRSLLHRPYSHAVEGPQGLSEKRARIRGSLHCRCRSSLERSAEGR